MPTILGFNPELPVWQQSKMISNTKIRELFEAMALEEIKEEERLPF